MYVEVTSDSVETRHILDLEAFHMSSDRDTATNHWRAQLSATSSTATPSFDQPGSMTKDHTLASGLKTSEPCSPTQVTAVGMAGSSSGTHWHKMNLKSSRDSRWDG